MYTGYENHSNEELLAAATTLRQTNLVAELTLRLAQLIDAEGEEVKALEAEVAKLEDALADKIDEIEELKYQLQEATNAN